MMEGLHGENVMDKSKFNREREESEIRDERQIGVSLAYACHHWANHLEFTSENGGGTDDLVVALSKVFQCNLSWLYALCSLHSANIAVTALHKAEHWNSVSCTICH